MWAIHISSQQDAGNSCSRCQPLYACQWSSSDPPEAQLIHSPCDTTTHLPFACTSELPMPGTQPSLKNAYQNNSDWQAPQESSKHKLSASTNHDFITNCDFEGELFSTTVETEWKDQKLQYDIVSVLTHYWKGKPSHVCSGKPEEEKKKETKVLIRRGYTLIQHTRITRLPPYALG